MLDLNPGHGKVTRIARGEPGIRSVHINSAKEHTRAMARRCCWPGSERASSGAAGNMPALARFLLPVPPGMTLSTQTGGRILRKLRWLRERLTAVEQVDSGRYSTRSLP